MKETHRVEENDLSALAERVAYLLSRSEKDGASVVLLEGDLGAGKTTFTQALASHLGVAEHVHSPTFILKKEYSIPHARFSKLIHVDAYRFASPKEAKVLRLEEDLKDRNAIVVVEWPSRMSYMRPDVRLDFSVLDDTTREVDLSYEKDI